MIMPGGAPELEGKPSETSEVSRQTAPGWSCGTSSNRLSTRLSSTRSSRTPKSFLPAEAGATCQREAFLFLSAPNSVTPVHIDPEHNFLLQIRGQKDMNVCPFPDSERERQELEKDTTTGATATWRTCRRRA